MPRGTEVPITPEVLSWAVEESGYTDAQVADHIGVSADDLASWKRGDTRPTLTRMRKLATKLHRQLAAFLLPAPPKQTPLQVQFRSIGPQPARGLSPTERRFLRRARRHQEIIGWLSQELNEPTPNLPRHQASDAPDAAGAVIRDRLNIGFSQQAKWTSPSHAFDHWREAVGGIGVTVFVYSLGRDSCNGFSLWHERAPLIAISSAWREEARIFTLFHELGHLLLRGSSACLERVGPLRKDPIERWCERFAAAVLLPARAIDEILARIGSTGRVRELSVARRVARKAHVSLRAATLRLIEVGVASRDLYEEIPPVSDNKPDGGGGGGGRNRFAIKEDEFGPRATRVFVDAVQNDILSRSQAVGYLDIPDAAFDDLAASLPSR